MQDAPEYRRVHSTQGEERGDGSITLRRPSCGLSSIEAARLLAEHGPNHLHEDDVSLWELLWQCGCGGPVTATLWCLLVALAVLWRRWLSCAVLLLAMTASAGCAVHSLRRVAAAARRVVAAQRQRCPSIVLRDGRWQNTPPSLLVPGDLVRLTPGSVVPADCTIDAVIEVNEAAITGESLPVAMGPESMPRIGSIVVHGEALGTVQFTGAETFAGKLVQMLKRQVQRDPALAPVKAAGLRRAVRQTLFVAGSSVAAATMLYVGFLLGYCELPLLDALEQTVLLALHALPLGLETAVAVAVGQEAWLMTCRERVLPLTLSALSNMASVDILLVDKTGTLTSNSLKIGETCYAFSAEYKRPQVLLLAALTLRWREPTIDPLDAMVLGAVDLSVCDTYTQLDYTPFSATTGRTEATVRGPDGEVFKVTKGLANTILRLAHNRERLRQTVERIMTDLGRRGLRCVMVARTDKRSAAASAEPQVGVAPAFEPTWHIVGIITFLDPLRDDACAAVERLGSCGVTVRVITGDHPLITKEMVRRLGLRNSAVATAGEVFPRASETPAAGAGGGGDGDNALGENYGGVLRCYGAIADARPQHKLLAVEIARQCGWTVGFLGDGINDAPALQHADAGIAFLTDDCTDALGECQTPAHTHTGAADAASGVAAMSTPATPWGDGFTDGVHFGVGASCSSWACAVADAVALTPSLHSAADALMRARACMCVVESVLRFRLCSALHMLLFILLSPLVDGHCDLGENAVLQLPPFVLSLHAGCLLLLAVLLGFDRPPPVHALQRPQRWSTAATLLIPCGTAAVGAAASLLSLWVLADSTRRPGTSWCHAVGLPPIPHHFAAAALYLQIALSTSLALLSMRARPMTFYWLSCPSAVVALALLTCGALATALCMFTPHIVATPAQFGDAAASIEGVVYSSEKSIRFLALWVWVWCLCWWSIQELARVGLAVLLRRLNAFGFSDTLAEVGSQRAEDTESTGQRSPGHLSTQVATLAGN